LYTICHKSFELKLNDTMPCLNNIKVLKQNT
jgi:hypothetical protein